MKGPSRGVRAALGVRGPARRGRGVGDQGPRLPAGRSGLTLCTSSWGGTGGKFDGGPGTAGLSDHTGPQRAITLASLRTLPFRQDRRAPRGNPSLAGLGVLSGPS